MRNIIQHNQIIYGGGASEISCALACAEKANEVSTLEQYAFRAFAEALEAVPLALAENSGLSSVDTIAHIKAQQLAENNPSIGIDCLNKGTAGQFFSSFFYSFFSCNDNDCSRYESTKRRRNFEK